MADHKLKKTNPPKGKKTGFANRRPAQREGGKPRLVRLLKENDELFHKARGLEFKLEEKNETIATLTGQVEELKEEKGGSE